jgi:hypothetical protein
MSRESYEVCSSTYGWEIDRIVPTERGGQKTLSNEQPLQWANNSSKGDGIPQISSHPA